MAVDLTYVVQTQYPTVNFLGGTQTQDAVAVGITTNGHGIYIEFRIPRSIYNATQVKDYSIGYTGTVESIAGVAGVAGVVWSQQPNAAGELTDYLTLTVVSDSGNSSANLAVPASQWDPTDVSPLVSKLVTQLNDAEGLTD
jgi:hypothetical protein